MVYLACGDKGNSPATKVAAADLDVQITAATIPILYSRPMSFDAGVPEFGTTTATTLSFSANDTNAAVPLFNVKTATDSASGTTTFGSCIFTINTSSFSNPSVLLVGSTIEISPCEVTVDIAGKAAGSNLTEVAANFKFGDGGFSVFAMPASINPTTGEVKLELANGFIFSVGSVDLTTVTGGN